MNYESNVPVKKFRKDAGQKAKETYKDDGGQIEME